MFAPLAEADEAFEWVKAMPNVDPNAETTKMYFTNASQYSQFIYEDMPDPPICVRLMECIAQDESGGMFIQEFPSYIFDRYRVPIPFIDKYTGDQPRILKAQRLTPTLGQLYWLADESGTVPAKIEVEEEIKEKEETEEEKIERKIREERREEREIKEDEIEKFRLRQRE
jgi:hypothetical protein